MLNELPPIKQQVVGSLLVPDDDSDEFGSSDNDDTALKKQAPSGKAALHDLSVEERSDPSSNDEMQAEQAEQASPSPVEMLSQKPSSPQAQEP
jgi:hypothetical protein